MINKYHGYLFLVSLVVLYIFLFYCFCIPHKKYLSDEWREIFLYLGAKENVLDSITHDNDVWYFNLKSTCVAFSESEDSFCEEYKNYCCGKGIHGDKIAQARAVLRSIKNGGVHDMCPLIYQSLD